MTGVSYDPTTAGPPRSRRGARRWLPLLVAAWALVLGVAAYLSARGGPPTAREQTSVADARPAVDRAVADIVGASGDAVAAVGEFTRIGACRISAVRDGERWEQAVTLYTRPGGAPALLDRLARGLPDDYRARVRHSANGKVHTLRADAGHFVAVSGGTSGAGAVRLVVATGCRAGSRLPDAGASPDPPTRAAAQRVFDALGLRASAWQAREVPCPGGGRLPVVTARSDPGAQPGPLPATLSTIGPDPVTAQPDVYAFRRGETSVVVSLREGVVTATATGPCG
jgi:hypothetical protein